MKKQTDGKAIRGARAETMAQCAEAYHQRAEAKPKESKVGSFTFYMFVACLLTWAAYSYGFTMGAL